ncbi:MAG TPA: GIY-YIG nuclease family protein [Candidatus Omnitrophota bacterium]|nr:GIY-YIG nuclease family protein [Candidatus Omnitrophota bacterium]HPD84397.1 GIY-YIG nuclease family protein [Candidatus Omnitrophota bacterium]HRZ03255.1 GIY-YIG nuclease family protein [Candidatus Omnitrophota bacterium]
MWYLYILECKNGQFYTGITDDIEQRFMEHKDGKGGHFTKKYGTNRLLYHKSFPAKHEAVLREKQVKGWSRKKKLMLIEGVLK